MQLQCKTKGCGVTMYQQQKDLPQGVTDYDERLKLRASAAALKEVIKNLDI